MLVEEAEERCRALLHVRGFVRGCQPSEEEEEEEEVNMDMGQGFIGTTQELNVDRGTLPCTLACSWVCSWLTATAQGAGGVHSCMPVEGHTHTSFSLSLLSFSLFVSL